MNDWRTIDELLELKIPRFPTERSALSRKVVKEGWERRKKDTPGKRGVTYEYRMPAKTHENCVDEAQPMAYRPAIEELSALLSALSDAELNDLLITIKRKGVETLLYLLDERNIRLLALDDVVKEKYLGIQPKTPDDVASATDEARECGADNSEQTTSDSLASVKRQAG